VSDTFSYHDLDKPLETPENHRIQSKSKHPEETGSENNFVDRPVPWWIGSGIHP